MEKNISVDQEKHDAAWYFNHPDYGDNCAQAILRHYGKSKEEIEYMKTMGVGHAPDGYCGALYGAMYILKDNPEAQQKVIDAFVQETGSPRCREIKKHHKVPCRKCVQIADNAVKNLIEPSNNNEH
ncbi:C-GCAxxG-C-C family (seleno)protein [Thermophagus sp. OGC60D27]|uniref:C-GCAxxG-C-C family (seleno)protein n=1 Tax=Thermophagus sp. OGC60D27 TaxID=3458415 RepID=UPI004037FAD3